MQLFYCLQLSSVLSFWSFAAVVCHYHFVAYANCAPDFRRAKVAGIEAVFIFMSG